MADPTDITSLTPERRKRDRLGERKGRSKPADIDRWERDYECVKLRRQAVDWDTIAETLGYASKGHAHNRFVEFMRHYPRADVEQMRDLELQRIEQAMASLMPKVMDGDVRATEVWNKLSERLSKLMGLDKPERRELTVISEDTLDRSIREMREEMERKARLAQDAGIELPEFTS